MTAFTVPVCSVHYLEGSEFIILETSLEWHPQSQGLVPLIAQFLFSLINFRLSLCWSLITIILSRSTIAISKAAAKEFESLPNPQRISTIAGLSFYTHARRTSDSDNSDSTLDDTTTASVTSTESQPFVQGQVFVVSSLGSQSFLPDETSGPPLYEILDDKQREALVFQTSRSELIKGTIFERRPSPLGLLLEPGTSDACGWEIEMEERRTDNI